MRNGIVDRFRSMPISGSALLVGQIVASVVRNLLATTLVVGVALVIGWRPTAALETGWLPPGCCSVRLALAWFAATIGLLGAASKRPTRQRSR